jgi:hypothetical protein
MPLLQVEYLELGAVVLGVAQAAEKVAAPICAGWWLARVVVLRMKA